MPVFIVGRILHQGLRGGGLDVLSGIILADIASLKERPLCLGLYALPIAGGGVCGPIIGAIFSEFETEGGSIRLTCPLSLWESCWLFSSFTYVLSILRSVLSSDVWTDEAFFSSQMAALRSHCP